MKALEPLDTGLLIDANQVCPFFTQEEARGIGIASAGFRLE
jgi:hypothetical protein